MGGGYHIYIYIYDSSRHISSAVDRSVVVLARAILSFVCHHMTGIVSATQWGLFASYQILCCVISGYWSHRVFGTCPACAPVLACDSGVGVDVTQLVELLDARKAESASWFGLTTSILFSLVGVGLGWLAGVRCRCGCVHRYWHSISTPAEPPALTVAPQVRDRVLEPLFIPRASPSETSSPQRSPTSSVSSSIPEETVAVWKSRRR